MKVSKPTGVQFVPWFGKQLESKTGKTAISSEKASDYLLPPEENGDDYE